MTAQLRTGEVDYYLKFLPEHAFRAVDNAGDEIKARLTELRLRENAPLSLTVGRENVLLDAHGRRAGINGCVRVSKGELELCVNKLCDGSYHAQADNIRNGFIITGAGHRVGVCGKIIYNGRDVIIDEVTSVNMRVNRFVAFPECRILELLKNRGLAGVLIYSPPGGGKTTLLRYIAVALSKGLHGLKKYRTALIDERRELYMESKMRGGLLDIFYGYRKCDGIDCATRTLNPDIIICDEIGALEDTQAILSAQNSGVPLIATTHAGSLAQLSRKPNINALTENGVFEYLVGIRLGDDNIIRYEIARCGHD